MDASNVVKWGWLLPVVYCAFTLAFPWFFAGRRYWKSWKSSKLEAPQG